MKKIVFLCMLILLVFNSGMVLADSINLTGTVRDFKYYDQTLATNPDFQNYLGEDKGIVETTLGADGNPIYTGETGNLSTHGKTYFDQWYNNDPMNTASLYTISLDETSPGSGIYSYQNSAFFPIDNQGFGNQGSSHNYSFTYELETTFTYKEGQEFSFTGDDDVWVFINKQLVIDLGGVHAAQSASVDLDTLGLTDGKDYAFNFFFAERHTTESNLKITTSIALKPTPSVPEPATMLLLGSSLFGLAGFRKKFFKK